MSHILITGGAGFVGTNLAAHYLAQGHTVMVFDNLVRAGVEKIWLGYAVSRASCWSRLPISVIGSASKWLSVMRWGFFILQRKSP